MPISLGLGSSEHLARTDDGKGASIGQFAVKKSMWRTIWEINEEAHLQYVILSMGAASFCQLRPTVPVLDTRLS